MRSRWPAPVTADTDALGSWRRMSRGSVRLRAAPALTAPIVRDLPQHTVVHVDGAVRDWYRVQLPDGTAGFVSGRLTESTGRPVRTARVGAVHLLDRPMVTAAPVADLEAQPRLPVLGRFEDFLFVRTRTAARAGFSCSVRTISASGDSRDWSSNWYLGRGAASLLYSKGRSKASS